MQTKTVISEQEEYNDALSKPFDGYVRPASTSKVMAEIEKLTYTPETSPFVVEPPSPVRRDALEAAAMAAMNWHKHQALRPTDMLPVDYVCREIGKAIRAMQG